MSECINQVYAINGRRGVQSKPASLRSPAFLIAFLQRAVEMLAKWQERADGRHELGKLDDRMLRDIGISRADAVREADKPFWRR